jgi:hypothetical protein
VLQKANGVIATVGLEADLSQEAPAPAPAPEIPAADQAPNGALAPGAPASGASAPGASAPGSPAP